MNFSIRIEKLADAVDDDLDELDAAAETRAAWPEIKEYILKNYGHHISSLHISQIKRKCGLETGQNYNMPKSEYTRRPKCPPEKEESIRTARD